MSSAGPVFSVEMAACERVGRRRRSEGRAATSSSVHGERFDAVMLVPHPFDFERLTKPSFDETPDDEGCGQRREGQMEVAPALVADGEAAELSETGQGPLDDPPVPAQTLTALDPAAGDAVLDATAGESPTTAAVVVDLVGIQPGGAFTRPPPALADRRDGIHDRLQHPAVVHVRARQLQREGDALRVGEEVALRAGLAPVRFGPVAEPPLAAIEALSSEARLKSMPFWRPSRSSSAFCRRSHTPGLLPVAQASPARHARAASPSPGAATPRACPSAARTGWPSALRGRTSAGGRLSAWAAQAATAGRSRPISRRAGAVSPSLLNAPQSVLLEALSSTLADQAAWQRA